MGQLEQFLSDISPNGDWQPLIDHINQNYVRKGEVEKLKDSSKKYKKALLYMLNQFAYDEKRNKEEDEPLFTGGLSSLEETFDVLNIEEGISRKETWKMIRELLEEN